MQKTYETEKQSLEQDVILQKIYETKRQCYKIGNKKMYCLKDSIIETRCYFAKKH
jgi:hypothetical protein